MRSRREGLGGVMGDLFVVDSGALPMGARVVGFRGSEKLSSLYELDVFVSVSGAAARAVDLADAVSTRMTLSVARPEGGPDVRFNGIIVAFELVSEVVGPTSERAVFRITLAPQLWLLGSTFRSRVFTKQSIPEIISAVLLENGFATTDFELRLSSSYAIEEHVCQYRESDLDFVSRWMEREGLYYFFEHSDREERLVITDHLSAHARFSPRALRYHPLSSGMRPETAPTDALYSVTSRHAAQPARVLLQDYDYKNPGLLVTGSSMVSAEGLGDVSIYGDRFFTPSDGARLARIRAEAWRARKEILSVAGNTRDLRSGYLFELALHTRPEIDGEYLVVAMEHFGRAFPGVPELDAQMSAAPAADAAVYSVTAEAIQKDRQYRSPRATPWPRIHGYENAVVDGSATSQYAQIDDQGRYSIKLKLDESPLRQGQASTWVRMAQPHGGGVEGFHFPLRKGAEVLVEFLDGDPDRPLIVGVLPTATTPSPVTAQSHTKNVIQTGGSTRIEIEDSAGGQYMSTTTPVASTGFWMGAPGAGGHNVELATAGSGGFSSGTYFDRFVGGTKKDTTQGDVGRVYDSAYSTHVVGSVQETFAKTATTKIQGASLESFHSSVTETVVREVMSTAKQTLTQRIDGDVTEELASSLLMKIGGTHDLVVGGAAAQTFDKGLSVTVDAALSKHVANAGYSLEAKPDATFHAPASVAIRGDVKATLSSADTTVSGDATIALGGGLVVKVDAPAVTASARSVLNLAAPKIKIDGDQIQASGGTISVTGASITATSSGQQWFTAGGGLSLDGDSLVDVKASTILLNVRGPVVTGFGPKVDALAAMSPSLQATITALQQQGWQIGYGWPGLPTFCDPAKKIIFIDSSLAGNPEAVTQALAHQAGAASTQLAHFNPFGSFPEAVAAYEDFVANGEAKAQELEGKTQKEIVDAGGPDIAPGTPIVRGSPTGP